MLLFLMVLGLLSWFLVYGAWFLIWFMALESRLMVSCIDCFLDSWFLLRMDSLFAYGIRDLGLFLLFFPTVDDLVGGQSWRLCCGISELGGKKSDQPY